MTPASSFQKSGRIRMSQRVRRHVLEYAGFLRGDLEHLLNGRRLQRRVRRFSGKEIQRRLIDFPVRTQLVQQARRHRNDACLLPLAVADSQLHPRTVDVAEEVFSIQFSVFRNRNSNESGSEHRERI